MKKLWILFWFFLGGGMGSFHNSLGHFYTFWGFLRSRYRMGIFFGIAIFLGVCLVFLILFWGKQ